MITPKDFISFTDFWFTVGRYDSIMDLPRMSLGAFITWKEKGGQILGKEFRNDVKVRTV